MRRDLTIDWRDHYARNTRTPEEAVLAIRSGDHIWVPPLHVSPRVITALAARAPALHDVEMRGLGVPDLAEFFSPAVQDHIRYADQFGNILSRPALNTRTIDYHPHWLVGAHKGVDAGRAEGWRLDHVMITTSAPNAQGFVSIGGNCWDSVTSARRALHVIAAINPNVIETFGDSWLHVSEIDCFVPDERPQIAAVPAPPEAVDAGLAYYVETLVQDGDTVQIGTGSHTSGMVACGLFHEKQELSYFGELTVAGLVPLAQAGVFTGRTSLLHPGKLVATLIGNTEEERAAVHRNPAFEVHGIEYLLDPRNISRNEGIVAINGALGVDLTGQGAAYTIGPRIYAGMGGHLAFAMGAYLAPRGRYVCILPSTAAGGTLSTIVPQFAQGQVVSVPREIADTVVTEHGIARLLGKTVRQRADELISIAHPDFRAELRREAQRLFYP